MKKSTWVVALLFWLSLLAGFVNMHQRVSKLEQICHAQCKYGDASCAKRCQAAGHCESRMNDGE